MVSLGIKAGGLKQTILSLLCRADQDHWADHILQDDDRELFDLYNTQITLTHLRACRENTCLSKSLLDFALGIVILAANNTREDKPNQKQVVHTLQGKQIRIVSTHLTKNITGCKELADGVTPSWIARCINNLGPEDEEIWFPAHLMPETVTGTGHIVPGKIPTASGDGNHFVLHKLSLTDNTVKVHDSLSKSQMHNYRECSHWLCDRLKYFALALPHIRIDRSIQWTYSTMDVIQQPDDNVDCALHVLTTAASDVIGNSRTIQTVHQFRRILPILVMALSYDILMQLSPPAPAPHSPSSTAQPACTSSTGQTSHTNAAHSGSLSHLYKPAADFKSPKLLKSLMSNTHRARAVSRKITAILNCTAQKPPPAADPLLDPLNYHHLPDFQPLNDMNSDKHRARTAQRLANRIQQSAHQVHNLPDPTADLQEFCLLYTSPSPRD